MLAADRLRIDPNWECGAAMAIGCTQEINERHAKMAMSKSHYEACARAIRRRYEQILTIRDDNMSGVALGTLLMLATDLATLFADDNINFDRTRFLQACGVPNASVVKPRRGKGVTAAVKSPQNSPKPERTDHDDADRYGAFPRAD